MAKSRRHPLIWWGAGLMVVGVLAGAIGGGLFAAKVGSDLIRAYTAPTRTAPTDFTADLDEGTYLIYEQTAERKEMGPFFDQMSRGVTITPADVVVRGPDGSELPVWLPSMDETIDLDNSTFTGAARFTVIEDGVHRIEIDGQGQQVMLAPSVLGAFVGALDWLAVAAVGALVALVGLVLLIIGLVRAGRSSSGVSPRPAVQAVSATVPAPTLMTAAAAGWYADPTGLATVRWWDGQTWTDHVS